MKLCTTLSCKNYVTGLMPLQTFGPISQKLFPQRQIRVSPICKTFAACLTGSASLTHCYYGSPADLSIRRKSSILFANSISFLISRQLSYTRVLLLLKQYSSISKWIIRFHIIFGTFMDTPASLTLESLATFEANPSFHLSKYLPPRGGWRSVNDFFARHSNLGYRPIAAVDHSSIIVNPVDFTFNRHLKISSSSTVTAEGLTEYQRADG